MGYAPSFSRFCWLFFSPRFRQLLRNVPPSEWVAEVARTYPGDDEVKGMLGQVGKLMKMMDYYMAKKPKQ